VLITQEAYRLIEQARDEILRQIPKEYVTFSARLEDRALRFACAASLLNFFGSNQEHIPVSADAMKYAVQLYVEEASVRSKQEFRAEDVLAKIG
jgi:5-methylthioribose kinase